MSANVTRRQSDCLVQFSFNRVPIPAIPPTQNSEGVMDFADAVVQGRSMSESLLRTLVSQLWRHLPENCQIKVSVGQTRVSQRKSWIFSNRFFEECFRLIQ